MEGGVGKDITPSSGYEKKDGVDISPRCTQKKWGTGRLTGVHCSPTHEGKGGEATGKERRHRLLQLVEGPT